jgi:hypothetical protein
MVPPFQGFGSFVTISQGVALGFYIFAPLGLTFADLLSSIFAH